MYGLDRRKVFLGRHVRENTFQNLAGHSNVIHIAANGFLDYSNPLYSYLVLAQGKFNEDEDGLLLETISTGFEAFASAIQL